MERLWLEEQDQKAATDHTNRDEKQDLVVKNFTHTALEEGIQTKTFCMS